MCGESGRHSEGVPELLAGLDADVFVPGATQSPLNHLSSTSHPPLIHLTLTTHSSPNHHSLTTRSPLDHHTYHSPLATRHSRSLAVTAHYRPSACVLPARVLPTSLPPERLPLAAITQILRNGAPSSATAMEPTWRAREAETEALARRDCLRRPHI